MGDVEIDGQLELGHAGEAVALDTVFGDVAKEPLDMFSHEALVGVKCMTRRGCLASQACTSEWVCVA